MAKETRTVALIFGGKSVEHEISVRSAKTVAKGLEEAGFVVQRIGITKEGAWYTVSSSAMDEMTSVNEYVYSEAGRLDGSCFASNFVPGSGGVLSRRHVHNIDVDVVFPLIHGTGGEDGSLQGYLELVGVPYVGSRVQASAVCMDKVLTKKVLRAHDIPVVKDIVVTERFFQGELPRGRGEIPDFDSVAGELGLPFFVKPAHLGSSIGISKVICEEEFEPAFKAACKNDDTILFEQAIDGRELECAVLNWITPDVAGPGEIITPDGWYSYEEKYSNQSRSKVVLEPENLDSETCETIRQLARNAFMALGCHGLARVDMFFVSPDEVYINEVNTIPGFTSISMYPKLWEGVLPLPKLLKKLIDGVEMGF